MSYTTTHWFDNAPWRAFRTYFFVKKGNLGLRPQKHIGVYITAIAKFKHMGLRSKFEEDVMNMTCERILDSNSMSKPYLINRLLKGTSVLGLPMWTIQDYVTDWYIHLAHLPEAYIYISPETMDFVTNRLMQGKSTGCNSHYMPECNAKNPYNELKGIIDIMFVVTVFRCPLVLEMNSLLWPLVAKLICREAKTSQQLEEILLSDHVLSQTIVKLCPTKYELAINKPIDKHINLEGKLSSTGQCPSIYLQHPLVFTSNARINRVDFIAPVLLPCAILSFAPEHPCDMVSMKAVRCLNGGFRFERFRKVELIDVHLQTCLDGISATDVHTLEVGSIEPGMFQLPLFTDCHRGFHLSRVNTFCVSKQCIQSTLIVIEADNVTYPSMQDVVCTLSGHFGYINGTNALVQHGCTFPSIQGVVRYSPSVPESDDDMQSQVSMDTQDPADEFPPEFATAHEEPEIETQMLPDYDTPTAELMRIWSLPIPCTESPVGRPEPKRPRLS